MIDETLQRELAATLLKKILPAELHDEALKSLDAELTKNSPTENLREENSAENSAATKNETPKKK